MFAVREKVCEGVLKSTFWAYGVVRLLILCDVPWLIVFVENYPNRPCYRASVRPPLVCFKLCGCQSEGESSGPLRLNAPRRSISVSVLKIQVVLLSGYRFSDGGQR